MKSQALPEPLNTWLGWLLANVRNDPKYPTARMVWEQFTDWQDSPVPAVTAREYVCGFHIVPRCESVLLIKKNRPSFQMGKWNGIGGKIEPGEQPIDAMVREFREECGITTAPEDWTHTITMMGDGDQANAGASFAVHYYRMFSDELPNYRQMTDEFVSELSYRHGLWDVPTLDNMRWIVPIQLNHNLQFPIKMRWTR